MTERHRLHVDVPPLDINLAPLSTLDEHSELAGIVIRMDRGWPGSSHIRFASRVLAKRRRVWLHWHAEDAFECVDAERIRSLWRHWLVVKAFQSAKRLSEKY